MKNFFYTSDWREQYDWCEAFKYAGTIRTATGCAANGFGLNDVALVMAADEGENDGPSWIMVGLLHDGRFFFLEAGCDYTGWDCQAGGDAQVAGSFEDLVRFGMTQDARARLGIPEPE